MAVIMEILKVTQGHWNRHGSIGCPLLPIVIVTMGQAYLVLFPR